MSVAVREAYFVGEEESGLPMEFQMLKGSGIVNVEEVREEERVLGVWREVARRVWGV